MKNIFNLLYLIIYIISAVFHSKQEFTANTIIDNFLINLKTKF